MAVRLVALVILALIAAALVWIAAEQHYRACMESRLYTGHGARSTVATEFGLEDPPPLSAVTIEGCSRVPF